MGDTDGDGPKSLVELFDWPSFNAHVLMNDEQCRNSFVNLVDSCNIVVFDSFAGTGNGSVCVKKQFNAFLASTGKAVDFTNRNKMNLFMAGIGSGRGV